jgi:hypothetical protein
MAYLLLRYAMTNIFDVNDFVVDVDHLDSQQDLKPLRKLGMQWIHVDGRKQF